MFCIRYTAAIWDQHMPKMGATVTTCGLHWTFTSVCSNSSTCSQSKNRPRITSITYSLRQFIHNSSIYEQKLATSKLGWVCQKTRASNRKNIKSGEDLSLFKGRFRWKRFYTRTQSNFFASGECWYYVHTYYFNYSVSHKQYPCQQSSKVASLQRDIMRLKVIMILKPLRRPIWKLLAWDDPNELRIWWILLIQIMMVQR